MHAIWALGKLKAEEAVQPLIESMEDSDLYVVDWCIWALGEINDQRALEPLTSFILHKETRLRKRAFEALLKFQDTDSRKSLVKGLVTGAGKSNRAAEMMLRQLISKEGDEVILRAFEDPGGDEANTVGNYIELMESNIHRVSDIVKRRLKDPKDRRLVITEVGSFIRKNSGKKHGKAPLASIRFIGDTKDPDAYPILLEIVRNRQSCSTGSVRTAINVIAGVGYMEASSAVLKALVDSEEHPWVRSDAAKALGKLGEKKACDTLLSIIQRPQENKELREAAITSLGRMGEKRAVEPLIALLRDDSAHGWQRCRAAIALGEIGDAKAIEPLLEASKDSSGYLRNAAKSALRKLQKGEQVRR
jgi:HEAT repeat protein